MAKTLYTNVIFFLLFLVCGCFQLQKDKLHHLKPVFTDKHITEEYNKYFDILNNEAFDGNLEKPELKIQHVAWKYTNDKHYHCGQYLNYITGKTIIVIVSPMVQTQDELKNVIGHEIIHHAVDSFIKNKFNRSHRNELNIINLTFYKGDFADPHGKAFEKVMWKINKMNLGLFVKKSCSPSFRKHH
jgi:hypothetical protein